MSKIKILISCHKPTQVFKSDLLEPIQVGCENTNERFEGMIYDNDGENISAKNPMYCELTAQYWAWKNLDSDYYGFFHYRRYLNFSSNNFALDEWGNVIEDSINLKAAKKYDFNDESMCRLIEQYDIVISEEKDVSKMPDKSRSVYEQYKTARALHIEDLKIIRKIIKNKYPEYLLDFDQYLKSNKTCLCNMYIMKKNIFEEYAAWLFDILEEFERLADMSNYSVEGLRTPGHLAERLLTLYYLHLKRTRNLKIKTLQTVVFLNTDIKNKVNSKELLPSYSTNNVIIALAANDFFVPYMSTLVQSIIEHSTAEHNYDILILTQDISNINMRRITGMIKDYINFNIRFIDPTELISGYDFFVRGHFSLETYYRLVLPELLPNFEKILYLDSDMVVQADVADLYNENVQGYLLAACHDADTAGLYNGYEPGKKVYTDQVLKLKEPYQYFQAGVLLMNLTEFRQRFTTEEILKFAVSEKWELLDQDILNKLCEGHVKYVDMSWNMMVDFGGIRIRDIIGLAPKWLNDMYLEARKTPRIIHYAGPEKPWYYPEMDQGVEFWHYARMTPYLEIMLSRMYNKSLPTCLAKPSLLSGGIQCIREHGLQYTMSYLPRRLFNK